MPAETSTLWSSWWDIRCTSEACRRSSGAWDGILPATISQVTACSRSWEEPSVRKGCCSVRTRTCSSDLFREHPGLSILKDDISYSLSLWLHVRSLWVRVLMGWRDRPQTEWQARAIYSSFLHVAPGGICSAPVVCFLGWRCLRDSSAVDLLGKSQCVGAVIKVASETHG